MGLTEKRIPDGGILFNSSCSGLHVPELRKESRPIGEWVLIVVKDWETIFFLRLRFHTLVASLIVLNHIKVFQWEQIARLISFLRWNIELISIFLIRKQFR